MKFRFCGDGDCPDWVLTEIPTLTRLTSIKMRLLCGLVTKALAGEDMDFERARTLTADAKFGEADVQGAVAALRWLLGSASKHSVDADSFSSELQQLGLPREHAQAAAKVFGEHVAAITAHLKTLSLRVSALEGVSCSPLPSHDADAVLDRHFSLSLSVRDGVAGGIRTHDLTLSRAQLQDLLSELHRAKSMMEG
ncbi:COMM domain-containing protein 4 isoform X3 [Frankliniella occidentalis]|uniref:COMM domain-containing protein 4 isoform X3 n=1 Tax=Frankliniella occidentalis TaxID=133901 RepID=A0A6J1TLK6_FRAOC|nr:COMM domain-containing protein 4 isoform X3 [Frankliniella occidentalis]XP_052120504.1 COMM domain-containing protein 4 isoform X3 [Frankliniella occidentalis]XP_052120507.1 COMM domain-containing protein 4 isoform X3 [Frankliniella occidentalis]